MLTGPDEAKADLLSRAAEVGARTRGGGSPERRAGLDAAAFLRRYYRHVPPEDLLARAPEDVYGAAMAQWHLATDRPQGTAAVHVFTPSLEEHGWSCQGHTVVQVVTDDMPFLVDSVTNELTREGRAIHLVVHPLLTVRRDIAGRIRGLADDADDADDAARAGDAGGTDREAGGRGGGPQAVLESWMHVEIDRETEPGDLEGTAAALRRVLRDVREAVEDWQKMRAAALAAADELASTPLPAGTAPEEVAEARELLRWLADDHFTFLGYREHAAAPGGAPAPVPGTGLGILRSDQAGADDLAAVGAPGDGPVPVARADRPLVLTKADSRSTVHRLTHLDYVGVRRFDEDGALVAERRFLGLLSSAAYTESIKRIPVLRQKAREVLARSGFPPTSHSGKDMLEILETYPRDELFQVDVEELEPVVRGVAHLRERRQLRVFLRRDGYGRFMSCLVFLPRDRYTTDVRLRMQEILREAFDGDTVDYTARVTESVLARLHFVVRLRPGAARTVSDADPAKLEARLAEATRSWADDLGEALLEQVGEEEAARLLRVWPDAFPEAYKEDFPARIAVADLRRVDALDPGGALAMSLYTPYGAGPGERRLKLYRDRPVSLADVLPVLARMGVEVLDERPYELARGDGTPAWVYDFGLRYEPRPEGASREGEPAQEAVKERFQDTVAAVWAGAAENDGFNALVLRAGLSWRQCVVLRAYAKYLRQAGSTFSQDYIEAALVANVGIARALVALFEARLDPARGQDRDARAEAVTADVLGALDGVASLDQDRILRSLLTLVRATLRTNAFQAALGDPPRDYVCFKLDSGAIPELPRPRPSVEIWVYSPRVEGVHLRFGPVARGGLRWSDRREDFRTEVLGLVKAQMVKNAVIVPTGAKGGFVVKRPPVADPSTPAGREAVLAEGVACYRTFVSALLDVTDNLVGERVVAPRDVVRHDGDDPYLVVAADKGTAAFSDVANAVALDHGFWLGDAFASGGSAGYDHKAMGITARGAWESVRRHFRELGHDTQSQDFTVVGIGDMSGDVFGNGMLLSGHIRLLAAFDHRHVFLDPDPDPAASHAERRRLFELPRSSWADYDPALISPGGGVHPRTAKSVPVTAAVRAALGLEPGVEALSPAELMRAVLTAPVDLFWNGGIGTYVKAAAQSHGDVGDKANDAIRVDGARLRARVVGEGGNLGVTQLGRIEYALSGADGAGGHVNTDAIDNSAGVDTSDHEVNIKILLDRVVADGDLTGKQRDALLAEMTDEVARLVLRDNYEQNVLLGNARAQAASMLSVHRRLVASLERRGLLNRGLEALPGDAVLEERAAAGLGLTSPELAVLVAYAKISLTGQLLATGLPEDPWFQRALRGYFPREVVERYADRLPAHPLRREIIVTRVVNDLVNRGGITGVFRAGEETGASPVEVTRAYTVAREVFGFERYWAAVEALDAKVATAAQTELHLEGRRLIDRSVRWLLQTRRSSLDVAAEIEHFGAAIAALAPRVPELLLGAERERLHRRAAEFARPGVPGELALQAAGLLDSFSLLDVVEIATSVGAEPAEVAEVYFALSERFDVDRMLTRITALPRDDRWRALARSALRYDLYAAHAGLAEAVLTSTGRGDPAAARIAAWEAQNAEGLSRARATLQEITASDTFDLATLSVALRVIRTLLR